MPAPERIEHRQARTARDHVVLGVNLEPQPGRRTGQRLVEVLGLEVQSGVRCHGDRLCGSVRPSVPGSPCHSAS